MGSLALLPWESFDGKVMLKSGDSADSCAKEDSEEPQNALRLVDVAFLVISDDYPNIPIISFPLLSRTPDGNPRQTFSSLSRWRFSESHNGILSSARLGLY